MAKYFKTILIDIFVVDEDNPPRDFPTLNQLKYNFIIKVKFVNKKNRLLDQKLLGKMMV